MTDISFIEGPEWDVDLRWHDDGDSFALFFGEDLGFIYDIVDGRYDPCPDCGLWHQPWAPHAPTMGFLEHFVIENMRLPHWCDLTANCAKDHRDLIREYLDTRGQWSEPKDEISREDATARTVGGMAVHTKEKDPRSMATVTEPMLKRRLSSFVGVPNDERSRAAMAEAIEEVLRPIADAKVEVTKDPVNEDVMRVNVVYEPVMAPREVRVVKAAVLSGFGEFRGKDGEGSDESNIGQPEAPSPSSRGEREDSSDMSSSGGEPG